MSLTVFSSDRFAEHQTPPGHPDSSERADVMTLVASDWRHRGGEVIAPRGATREQLARVHDPDYLDRVAASAGRAVSFDLDTYTSPESYEVALLAAGAAIEAVERVMADFRRRTLALVRPPGHHAERDRAMGFCLLNNVAVAAAHARALGAGRVAIVDYDVHHGNGTQHMFESDPSVLYVSTHQYPEYPGTGAADEIGIGSGTGFTLNLPLEAGAADQDYRCVFSEVIGPVLRQFRPDVVLVSAGFDAHQRDPLAGMRLTTSAFAAMTREIAIVADDCCDGRVAVVTEGGYDMRGLEESLRAVIEALAPDRASAPGWPSQSSSEPTRGRAVVAAARAAAGRFWTL
jgi:acetoin utilization deacetylase AcuC-like enzyme